MAQHLKIGLIGDFHPEVTAHVAIPQALDIAGQQLGYQIEGEWIATDVLTTEPSEQLAHYNGLWCVPASPYKNMAGAIAAIRFAREAGKPFLGT